MLIGGLMLGAVLIGIAWWLHWNEHHGWPQEPCAGDGSPQSDGIPQSDLDRRYLRARGRSRRRVNLLLGGCGVLIMIAAVGGPQTPLLWIGCWMIVMVTLFTIVFLAAFDAWRTQRYHAQKLPELRRQAARRSR